MADARARAAADAFGTPPRSDGTDPLDFDRYYAAIAHLSFPSACFPLSVLDGKAIIAKRDELKVRLDRAAGARFG